MRAIDIAVSDALPEDLRQGTYNLDKKGLAGLMAQVATSHPDKFAEVAKRLGDLGRHAAYQQGYTISDTDMDPVLDRKQMFTKMDAEIKALRKQKLTPEEFANRRDEVFMQYADVMEKETMKAALGRNNAWANAAASGARGNAAHIRAILTTPGLFADTKGRVIPLFVRNSYSDGVRPAELLAGSYGARLSVVSTKTATAKGGDFGKQLVQNASNYNITEQDCGTDNGIDLAADDTSLIGRVTMSGEAVDRQSLAGIRKLGKPVIVRSPLTCKSRHGLCAKCAGLQADGKFPQVGDSIGVTAATAIREPIVQGSLNTKHNCLYINDFRVLSTRGSVLDFHTLKVGDELMGFDGNTRSPVKVTAKIDQGLQPVATYNFALPGGRLSRFEITSTKCHEVLTADGKRPIGETDHILIPRNCEIRAAIHEPLAFFAGFFMGDGIRFTSGKSQSLKISCAEKDTAQELNDYLSPLGFCLKKRKRSHDWAVVSTYADRSDRDPKTGRIVSSPKHAVKQLVRRLGWEDSYALTKTIPAEVWTWDDASVNAFVSGFLTADGSVYKGSGGALGVAMSSTSLDMMERLQQLLWSRLGVLTSRITRTGKVGTPGAARQHDQFQFTVTRRNELAILSRKLMPMGPKRSKLAAIAAALPLPNLAPVRAKLLGVTPIGDRHCVDISVDAANELFSLANGAVVKNSGMAKGRREFAGFDYINQFVQIPDEFKDKATVSEIDGDVEKIEPAAQGGNYVTVNGVQHYTLPGFELRVKAGDKIEAGEFLSDGLANPSDIVRLRGLGEGRKYYADRLQQMLKESGYPADRVNLEIIAKSAVDNYRIEDPEDEDMLPDSLMRENEFMAGYKPAVDTKDEAPSSAVGGYLQKPVLHYTTGTRITPKIAERISGVGVAQIPVSRKEPWFKADMVRLRAASHDSDDWLRSMGTSYLSKQLQQSVEAGEDTDVNANYHYGPRLAYGVDAGSGGFGEKVKETGMF